MKCFRCKKDKEQLLTVDNKDLNFKESVCFPCVVKCLRDHKKKQATEMMKKIMEGEKI
jgi:hypothetical protein